MVIFNTTYYSPMDRVHRQPSEEKKSIEEPIISPISEVGKTVAEGRGMGTFLDTMRAGIFEGAGKIELALSAESGAPMEGAEAYGKTARRELKELAKANEITITSVHAPHQIGNLSGLGDRGFNDQQRELEMNEIKKAIEFASDVGGTAVVVHTGEYQRPLFMQKWAQAPDGTLMFRGFEEEPERVMIPLVDKRSGSVIESVRMNQQFPRAKWLRSDKNDASKGVKKGDYIDYEGNKVEIEYRVPEFNPEKGLFEVQEVGWKEFVEEANERNKIKEQRLGRKLTEMELIRPEEAVIIATTETQEKVSRGWALNYSQGLKDEFKNLEKLKEVREIYAKMEASTPPEERWKLKREMKQHFPEWMIPPEQKMPTEWIDEQLEHTRKRIQQAQEMVVGQQQSAELARITKENVISIDKYAKTKSNDSYAELGIHAMKTTHEKGIKKPIFVAPEHIFPEMGYGSHPQELIELVTKSRERMVELMTKQKVKDPITGQEKTNQFFQQGVSVEQARKEAEEHIKATLDTQHLGMWYRYFQPKPGETEEQRRQRFNGWYMDQIKEFEKKGIIGHVHVVDGWGRGHTHLPAGEGTNPVVTALEYLKKKGYAGHMVSEGFGEPGRQLTRTWEAFGSSIYSTAMGPMRIGSERRWSDVWQSYFAKTRTTYYVVGQYSPSEDWTLWSQVPFE